MISLAQSYKLGIEDMYVKEGAKENPSDLRKN